MTNVLLPANSAGTPRPRIQLANADRIRQIAAAALVCFSSAGYRLTQVVHVTERLGVSAGSIYRYVESKEALFHIAALEAVGRLPADLALPIKVSGFEATLAVLREVVAEDKAWPILESATSAPPPADLKGEARDIAAELYAAVTARAPLIRLLDRCSHELPELAEIFDVQIRTRYLDDLVAWVLGRHLIDSGDKDEAAAVARGVMEAVTWLARNRPRDRTATMISDSRARAAAVRIFANAFDYEPPADAPTG
jgi:AcrR family transcriptional regulator